MNLITIAHSHAGNPLAPLDCHIAVTYLELAAYSINLGVCWLGFLLFAQNYPPIKKLLNLPEGHKICGTALIGYPRFQYQRIPLRKKPVVSWFDHTPE